MVGNRSIIDLVPLSHALLSLELGIGALYGTYPVTHQDLVFLAFLRNPVFYSHFLFNILPSKEIYFNPWVTIYYIFHIAKKNKRLSEIYRLGRYTQT